MKLKKVEARHKLFRDDMIAVLKKHAGDLDATEMLALAAHLTGQLIAFQDQRTVTPAMALEIVSANVEAGNQEALREVQNPLGTA